MTKDKPNSTCWKCGAPALVLSNPMKPRCSNPSCRGKFYDPQVGDGEWAEQLHQASVKKYTKILEEKGIVPDKSNDFVAAFGRAAEKRAEKEIRKKYLSDPETLSSYEERLLAMYSGGDNVQSAPLHKDNACQHKWSHPDDRGDVWKCKHCEEFFYYTLQVGDRVCVRADSPNIVTWCEDAKAQIGYERSIWRIHKGKISFRPGYCKGDIVWSPDDLELVEAIFQRPAQRPSFGDLVMPQSAPETVSLEQRPLKKGDQVRVTDEDSSWFGFEGTILTITTTAAKPHARIYDGADPKDYKSFFLSSLTLVKSNKLLTGDPRPMQIKTTEQPYERRRALLRITPHCIGQFLRQGEKWEVIKDGLPKDVKVLGIIQGSELFSAKRFKEDLYLKLESREFDIVPENEALPELDSPTLWHGDKDE